MTQEEYNKVKEYSNKLEKLNKICTWIEDNFEKELIDFFDNLISIEGWEIIAHDTHRWVRSDGFYEVEFNIKTNIPDFEIYIRTKCGDMDLQEMWSENNPQKVHSLRECYMDSTWNWHYFVDMFLSEINEQIENGNFKIDENNG